MGRVVRAEVGTGGTATEASPGVQIWRAIEASPQALAALEKGKRGPIRRAALQKYLTTGKTQAELLPLKGVKTPTGVWKQLHRSMEIVYPYLPQELQDKYQAPEQAFRARSGTIKFSDTHSRNVKEGLQRRARQGLTVGRPRKPMPTTQ